MVSQKSTDGCQSLQSSRWRIPWIKKSVTHVSATNVTVKNVIVNVTRNNKRRYTEYLYK